MTDSYFLIFKQRTYKRHGQYKMRDEREGEVVWHLRMSANVKCCFLVLQWAHGGAHFAGENVCTRHEWQCCMHHDHGEGPLWNSREVKSRPKKNKGESVEHKSCAWMAGGLEMEAFMASPRFHPPIVQLRLYSVLSVFIHNQQHVKRGRGDESQKYIDIWCNLSFVSVWETRGQIYSIHL